MDGVGDPGVGVLAVLALVYFVPFFVAVMRYHKYKTAIFVLNLFAGWTFLGWVGALVWAFIGEPVYWSKKQMERGVSGRMASQVIVDEVGVDEQGQARKGSDVGKTALLAMMLLLPLAGCTATLTATGGQVRVTNNPEVVRGKEYIGTVHQGAMAGGMAGVVNSSERAYTKLRNKAAEMGGDTVYVVSESGNNVSGVTVTAEVYRSK